ncbi:major pollen allergen Ole e 10-like isoform X1 [Primulina eburnea]|uniref:major pollen allergen Ole e 10-like isoform X1 n=1 Tax=Primulina eburnea TaxID=1245227 RepID=UPI003C6CB459
MAKKIWVLLKFVQCFLIFTVEAVVVQEKAEAAVPVTTLSPPEGNTTFLGGTTWCVARAGVSAINLQVALDWACGLGKADCGPIQAGGPCFNPNSLLSHASYAFNSYYQQNGNSDIACFFGGTATLTQDNPSYDKCLFGTSGSVQSKANSTRYEAESYWWKIEVILLYVLIFNKRWS